MCYRVLRVDICLPIRACQLQLQLQESISTFQFSSRKSRYLGIIFILSILYPKALLLVISELLILECYDTMALWTDWFVTEANWFIVRPVIMIINLRSGPNLSDYGWIVWMSMDVIFLRFKYWKWFKLVIASVTAG